MQPHRRSLSAWQHSLKFHSTRRLARPRLLICAASFRQLHSGEPTPMTYLFECIAGCRSRGFLIVVWFALVLPVAAQQPPPDATWTADAVVDVETVDHRRRARGGSGCRRARRQGLRVWRRVPGRAARRRHPRVYGAIGADRPRRLAAPRRKAADRAPHRPDLARTAGGRFWATRSSPPIRRGRGA